SRRRHTRSKRDWSSDVCSSDLAAYRLWPNTDLMIGIGTRLELPTMSRWPYRPDGLKSVRIDIDPVEMRRFISDAAVIADAKAGRSEERRVGKEVRAGCWAEHGK